MQQTFPVVIRRANERVIIVIVERLPVNLEKARCRESIVLIQARKHFEGGELRHLPKTDDYELTLTALDKTVVKFVGKLTAGKQKEVILVLERTTETQTQQISFTLLHGNRYLYQLATKPKGAKNFARVWQVGATKEGEPFAEVNKGPECIVTGGRGTMSVSYKGKTYYVCCSGCKEEFNAEPEKYIRLAAEKKK